MQKMCPSSVISAGHSDSTDPLIACPRAQCHDLLLKYVRVDVIPSWRCMSTKAVVIPSGRLSMVSFEHCWHETLLCNGLGIPKRSKESVMARIDIALTARTLGMASPFITTTSTNLASSIGALPHTLLNHRDNFDVRWGPCSGWESCSGLIRSTQPAYQF